MAESVLIPIRRGDQKLVFAYVENVSQRRWQFQAAVCNDGPGGALRRTGAVEVTRAEMDRARHLVKVLPAIEKAFENVRLSQIDTFPEVLEAGPDAAVVTGSMLFTTSMYINFMRQYLVEESAIRRYEVRPVEQRIDVGLTASIYDGLLKLHALERAGLIVTADLQCASPPERKHREWSYLFKLAAEIRLRQEQTVEGVALLERAAKLWPEAGLYRRIGNLHYQTKNTPKAIETFLMVHALEPLGAAPSGRLGWWLFEENRTEEALQFAHRARDLGDISVQKLLDKIATP